jgi:hypothetical protein
MVLGTAPGTDPFRTHLGFVPRGARVIAATLEALLLAGARQQWSRRETSVGAGSIALASKRNKAK